MTEKEIIKLVKVGENNHVEVKQKTEPSIIPDAEQVIVKGKTVVVLSTKEFPIKPVSFKGRYYKRVKNANHQLSINEISDLHLKTFSTSWDNYSTNEYDIGALSLDKVNKFIAKSNKFREIEISDDPLTVLRKFELIHENKITNACYLLFSENDVFQATIELGRFSTPTIIKDGLTLRSDLFSEVEDVLNFIKKHINKAFIITGNSQREERWDYPLDAIREIVLNMIIHRDYMHYGDSSVKIFNDNIEFFNPGALPDTISIAQLLEGNYSSQTRNKKIASIFKEAGVIEKYGSGIKRIRDAFISYGLKAPVFENFQHGFKVIVFANKKNDLKGNLQTVLQGNSTEKVTDKVTDNLPENQIQIIRLMSQSAYITTKELSNKIKISQRKIKENINKLKEKGLIKRHGKAKGGYWEILK